MLFGYVYGGLYCCRQSYFFSFVLNAAIIKEMQISLTGLRLPGAHAREIVEHKIVKRGHLLGSTKQMEDENYCLWTYRWSLICTFCVCKKNFSPKN